MIDDKRLSAREPLDKIDEEEKKYFVIYEWMGLHHHSIEYGAPKQLSQRMGNEIKRIELQKQYQHFSLRVLTKLYNDGKLLEKARKI